MAAMLLHNKGKITRFCGASVDWYIIFMHMSVHKWAVIWLAENHQNYDLHVGLIVYICPTELICKEYLTTA